MANNYITYDRKTREAERRALLIAGDRMECKRFWAKTTRIDGCVVWTGASSKSGYGFLIGTSAHRLSYQMANGPIQPHQVVHHRCATSACVNPDHLQLVTQRENVAEMLSRRELETTIRLLREQVETLTQQLRLVG